MTHNPNSVAGRALDRADARVRQDEGLGGAAPRLLGPRALGRPRHDPGGRGPRHHRHGVHLAQPGLRAAGEPVEPALRLRDHRHHLARHRLRADPRRDRPLGGLHVGARLGATRRALDQQWLAAGGGHPRGACRGNGRGRALRHALQPRGDALVRGDAGGASRTPRDAALPAGEHRLDQPALRPAARAVRAEPLHAELAQLRPGADPGRGDPVDRPRRAAPPAGGEPVGGLAQRPGGQGGWS